ncbi:MAG TPA: kynureninase [Nocardioidaceae bacterium]|nr:kynureninase [Nocardioidaceae bacterium]
MTQPGPGDLTRRGALQRDADDPLAFARARFSLPESMVYLDGNSLGALPRGVHARLRQVVEDEWGGRLIGSWNAAGWMELPAVTGAKIARLVGARPDEVVAADSTSVNLFKLLVAAARLRPGRGVIVTEPSTFPTDGYIAASVARTLGLELRWCDPLDPLASVGRDTAVLALTHVDFRTGRMYDMDALTRGAHAEGALMLWDLCHSAGAVPVDLTAAGADLAVGCTYKYLNAGPGAPAFCYVATAHQEAVDQPLTGWMGHAAPFAMDRDYTPATGVDRMRAGTPPILGLASLDAALDAFEGVDTADLRRKSVALTSSFIDLVREHTDLEVVTPSAPEERGSQVSLRHPQAYGVVQALIARGVVGDFRTPDIARFGFAPLYIRHVDVFDAVAALRTVLDRREYADPAYAVRAAVT